MKDFKHYVSLMILLMLIVWIFFGCSNKPAPWVKQEIVIPPPVGDCTYDHRTEETVCGNTIRF